MSWGKIGLVMFNWYTVMNTSIWMGIWLSKCKNLSFSKNGGDAAAARTLSIQMLTKAWHDFSRHKRMVLMTDNHLSQSTYPQTHPSQGWRGNHHSDQTRFLMSRSSLLEISCWPHALLGEPGTIPTVFVVSSMVINRHTITANAISSNIASMYSNGDKFQTTLREVTCRELSTVPSINCSAICWTTDTKSWKMQ